MEASAYANDCHSTKDFCMHHSFICRSVVQITKYMSQFSGVKLLLGDLNAEPHSNAIRYMDTVYTHRANLYVAACEETILP